MDKAITLFITCLVTCVYINFNFSIAHESTIRPPAPPRARSSQQAGVEAEIAKWENDISQLEQKNHDEPPLDDPIVCFGSSSFRLWDSMAVDMAPWPVYNRGYGGAKLPDIIHFANRVIGPYLGKSNPRRCRAVLLFVANDISGNPATDPTSVEVATRFTELLATIREIDPTIPVFWIEVTPSHSRWHVWPAIDAATKKIRTIIESDPNAYLISTAGAILGIDGKPKPELFREDQLHLSEQGYQIWSALIKAKLNAELGPAVPATFDKTQVPDSQFDGDSK